MVGKQDREGVENVSIEDVDGDGPFAGVWPNARGGGTVDDREVLSVIEDNNVLRIDLTTDSVCKGDCTGLRGGEGCKVGGRDIIVGGGTIYTEGPPHHLQKFMGYERSGIGPELELPQTQDIVGASSSLGQGTERAGSVLYAITLDHEEFGIAAGNKCGACVKLALKDVGSCWSGCALLLEGTHAHGGLGT